MENRDQTNQNKPARYLQVTCPSCKRRVRLLQEDPAKLPRFYPFCSQRCKLIDLGAWLDADYRIPSKPDDESDRPSEKDSATGTEDSHP
jgi:uncharacterized protein